MKQLFQEMEEYISEVISPLLPNARLGLFVDNNLKLFELGTFKRSIFEYNIDNSLFLHFTSVTNLFNILRTKKIRMSDLNLMNDKDELYFANKNLAFQTDLTRIGQLKSQ